MDFEKKSSPDILLFVVIIILIAIGLVMIYSASSVDAGFAILIRQLLWSGVGLSGMIFFMNFNFFFFYFQDDKQNR